MTDEIVEDFRAFLASERVKVDEQAFAADRDFIRAMIRYDVDLALFGVEEARRHLISKDPQAQLALSLFPEASRLSDNARRSRAVASRQDR